MRPVWAASRGLSPSYNLYYNPSVASRVRLGAKKIVDTALNEMSASDISTFTEGKGFLIRAWAYIIDMVILFVFNQIELVMTIFLVVWLLVNLTGEIPDAPDAEAFASVGTAPAFVVGLVESILYFAVFEWLFGATPGKLLTKLRVVGEDGLRCSLGRALLRGVLRFFDGLLFGAVALNSMKTPLNQRFGDKAAKTVVVSATDPGIVETRSGDWVLVSAAIYLAVSGINSLVTMLIVYL